MSKNLTMIDHAFKDSRSMSAMLHGTADGRALAWQSFEDAHPNISQEELMEKFSIDARYGHIRIRNRYSVFLHKKYIAPLIAFLIIVF